MLEDAGVDFVELSVGTLERVGHEWTQDITLERGGFFLESAELIVPQVGRASAERRTNVFVTDGLRANSAMASVPRRWTLSALLDQQPKPNN
ncbi:hypothetical protein PWT90_02611 [Aphanocladium album]|nr:hypothetical protein PWT90_02611 [Aphanocladium album]